jgi:hypothetical protein
MILAMDHQHRWTHVHRVAAGFAGARGYSIPRLTEYFGKFLRHGNAWPERQIRLYDRRAARWVGYEVHEKIAVDGPVGSLRHPLEHYAYRSLDDQLAKLDRYARLMATQMHAAGRRGRTSRSSSNFSARAQHAALAE